MRLLVRKNIQFDPVRGFRFLPGTARTVLIINNQLEYDTRITINNIGIPSKIDYFKKKNPNIFRYIVFGDSFTQGYFLDLNWPDNLNKQFKDKNIEFYNFAVDGGGLHNWYSIFFNEVLGNYDFDGIIIASFGNNLERGFYVMNPDYDNDIMRGGYIDSIPKSLNDLNQNYNLDKGVSLYKPEILIQEKLSSLQLKKFKLVPIRSYLFDFIIQRSQNLLSIYKINRATKRFESKYLAKPHGEYSFNEFINRYGEKKLKMLEEIIDTSKKLNKKIILCNIPDKESVTNLTTNIGNEFFDSSNYNILINEMMFLAENYDVKYFNGYEIFDNIPISKRNQYWFQKDGHWNQQGSDLYSDKFKKFIFKEHELENN